VSIGGQGSLARIPTVTIFPAARCALAVSGQAAAPPKQLTKYRRVKFSACIAAAKMSSLCSMLKGADVMPIAESHAELGPHDDYAQHWIGGNVSKFTLA
jgi:hypothetical protein